MNIWKGILAAFMLAAVFGCGMGTSKKNGSGLYPCTRTGHHQF